MAIFEWDENKAKSNYLKHKVSFDLAITAFDDPFALIAEDKKHSASEIREWLIGLSDNGILVIVFTRRIKSSIRLISARRASRKERDAYEEAKRISL